jgi:hypothetical protein
MCWSLQSFSKDGEGAFAASQSGRELRPVVTLRANGNAKSGYNLDRLSLCEQMATRNRNNKGLTPRKLVKLELVERERGNGNFFGYRGDRGGGSRAIGRIKAAVVVIMIGRIEAAVVGARWHGLSGVNGREAVLLMGSKV